MRTKVCVVGAGIVGLSSAVCVQNEIPDVDVTIMADRFSPNTTSDGAGGKWEPHLVSESQRELITKWGQVTFDYLLKLFRSPDAKDVGVQLVSGFNFRRDSPENQSPMWKDTVLGYRTLTDQEIQALKPGARGGIAFSTLILDGKYYLPWIMEKFRRNGGKVIQRKLQTLDEIADDYDIIINCSGLGAYHLVGDKSVVPIKGHLIKIYAPWLKNFYQDNDDKDFITIIPGVDTIALGGTSHVGDWSTDVIKADRERIWKGCVKLVPSLQNAKIVEEWVGLRPSRSTIRLEMEDHKISNNKTVKVIHNYGHSGSGITLFWGCAQDVVDLVKTAVLQRPSKL